MKNINNPDWQKLLDDEVLEEINLSEARSGLSDLCTRTFAGETFLINRRGRPQGVLVNAEKYMRLNDAYEKERSEAFARFTKVSKGEVSDLEKTEREFDPLFIEEDRRLSELTSTIPLDSDSIEQDIENFLHAQREPEENQNVLDLGLQQAKFLEKMLSEELLAQFSEELSAQLQERNDRLFTQFLAQFSEELSAQLQARNGRLFAQLNALEGMTQNIQQQVLTLAMKVNQLVQNEARTAGFFPQRPRTQHNMANMIVHAVAHGNWPTAQEVVQATEAVSLPLDSDLWNTQMNLSEAIAIINACQTSLTEGALSTRSEQVRISPNLQIWAENIEFTE